MYRYVDMFSFFQFRMFYRRLEALFYQMRMGQAPGVAVHLSSVRHLCEAGHHHVRHEGQAYRHGAVVRPDQGGGHTDGLHAACCAARYIHHNYRQMYFVIFEP